MIRMYQSVSQSVPQRNMDTILFIKIGFVFGYSSAKTDF